MKEHLKLSFSTAAFDFVRYYATAHSDLLTYILLRRSFHWRFSIYNFNNFSLRNCWLYCVCPRLLCFYFLFYTHNWSFFPSVVFRFDFGFVDIDISEVFFWISGIVKHTFIRSNFIGTLSFFWVISVFWLIFYKMWVERLVLLGCCEQIHCLHVHAA